MSASMSFRAGTTPSRFRLRSLKDLQEVPDPRWLIEGILSEGAMCEVHGPPASAKSFLVLDWALSVASGRPWHGRSVLKGDVVYIAAERALGLKRRSAAWRKARLVEEWPGVSVLDTAVQLLEEEDVDQFLRVLHESEMKPVLIVVDTLAGCFLGGDENSARDMNTAVHSLLDIQRATGAAVLVVHHTGKNTSVERGSSVLRGRMDVMVDVARKGDQITVSCSKASDFAPFDPMRLRIRAVELTERTSSCVLDEIENTAPTGASIVPGLPDQEPQEAWEHALQVLSESSEALSVIAWHRASEVPTSTLYRYRATLVELGYVAVVAGTRGGERFRVTPEGMDWLVTRVGESPSTDSLIAA